MTDASTEKGQVLRQRRTALFCSWDAQGRDEDACRDRPHANKWHSRLAHRADSDGTCAPLDCETDTEEEAQERSIKIDPSPRFLGGVPWWARSERSHRRRWKGGGQWKSSSRSSGTPTLPRHSRWKRGVVRRMTPDRKIHRGAGH